MPHISNMSRRLSAVYAKGLLVFSFMESSTLTFMWVLSLFLVFKLNKSCLKIIHLVLDHLIFLGTVDRGSYLVVTHFERWILTLGHFSDAFFLPVNCTSCAYISYYILDMENNPFEGF